MKSSLTILKLTVCFFAVCTTWSCSDNGEESGGLKRMNVEKYFESPDFDNISQKVKVVNIFKPEFTDSTMLSDPQLLALKDGKAYIHSQANNEGSRWMATFSYPDGRLISAFNHFGGGPEEYIYSYFAYFTPSDGIWTVMDINVGRYNIMQYGANGDFIRKTVNDSIQNISPMSNGNWLAFNDYFSMKGGPHAVQERRLYEYSKDWELVNSITLRGRRWKEISTALMDDINYLDGKNYVTDIDTVYEYDAANHSLIPVIAIILGKLAFDWGSIESWEELERVEYKYPTPIYPIFNDRYAFHSYYWGSEDERNVKFDLYNLGSGDLVYRRTVTETEENNMRLISEGFPVEVEGHTVYGTFLPFVKDNHFFVCVPMDELVKIYDSDEINPIIVEIEIAD